VAWKRRNDAKSSLQRPLDIGHVADEGEPSLRLPSTVEEDVEVNEAVRLVDVQLPLELRADLLRMRAGVSVPKKAKVAVEEAVAAILADAGLPVVA
jgi:hypothetical protein